MACHENTGNPRDAPGAASRNGTNVLWRSQEARHSRNGQSTFGRVMQQFAIEIGYNCHRQINLSLPRPQPARVSNFGLASAEIRCQPDIQPAYAHGLFCKSTVYPRR